MYEWSQGLVLTLTQDVDWGLLLLRTILPISGVVTQPHYITMSSQGIMSAKKAVTTLDCALWKDSNRVFEAGIGQEINFRTCLRVLQGPRHIFKCWFNKYWYGSKHSGILHCGRGGGRNTIQVWAWIAASMSGVAAHWRKDFESANRQEFVYSPLTQPCFRVHSVPNSI